MCREHYAELSLPAAVLIWEHLQHLSRILSSKNKTVNFKNPVKSCLEKNVNYGIKYSEVDNSIDGYCNRIPCQNYLKRIIFIVEVMKRKKYSQMNVRLSCGGTSKVTVRKSTLVYESIHGTIKNIPVHFDQ